MQETIRCPEMVTIKTAAERTGLSYDAIRKMCLERKIIYIKAGSKFLINFGKFVDYLNGGAGNEYTGEADVCAAEPQSTQRTV